MTQAQPKPLPSRDTGAQPDPRTRYAIYFTPRPETPLWLFGSSVLGYDAARGEAVTRPRLNAIPPERLAELTQRPRLYGFHATIKPPIRLADGCDEAQLIKALDAFCADRKLVALAPLVVGEIGGEGAASAFLALVESAAKPTPALRDLEAQVVEAFEPFRAPLTPEEYARRNPDALPPHKRELLDRYGYPAVLDAFTFHMTLSERVPGPERAALKADLEALRQDMAANADITIDHLALCRQRPGEPFRILHRADFAGARAS
ncbi:MAG: DUF1045 domain-containing protein [Salinarimonas sp.]|nr:DUF1045 domain-containing protein [Salinarimonas sp.]